MPYHNTTFCGLHSFKQGERRRVNATGTSMSASFKVVAVSSKKLPWFLLIITLPWIQNTLGADRELKCEQQSPCMCVGEYTIDLWPVSREAHHPPPRFSNVSSPGAEGLFFYDPCKTFTVGSSTTLGSCGLSGVSICHQNSTESNSYTSLGMLDSAKFGFHTSQTNVQIKYTDSNRTTFVTLNCAKSAASSTLTVDKVDTQNFTYHMTLSAPSACPKATGLSVGSVLLILFTVTVFLYLMVGMVYQYCVCGATGLEIVPNYEFWIDFPLLVRDGIIFALKCCHTEPTYDRI